MYSFLIFVILLVVLSSGTALRKSYSNYKVFEVQQRNQNEAELLYRLQQTNPNLDFWRLSRQVGQAARVLVPPEEQSKFVDALVADGLQYDELISDFQRTIGDATESNPKQSAIGEHILRRYIRHDEIDGYLMDLAKKHSSTVHVEEIGMSYEGRSLKTITITGKDGPGQKPVIFVDAGIHAREWIAPATALYIIQQLVDHPEDNDKALLANLTWVILPVVNPDGYEYTHEKQRLWRKTRSLGSDENCAGTDGNRNFEYHWAEVGASNYPCSDTYHGENAFSEPETRAIRNELLRLKNRCKFYLTLHSYGEYLLYPWGWTDKLPKTESVLLEVAYAGMAAISRATGTNYTIGSSTNVLYAAAGGSDDWAFAEAGIPVSITMELPGGGASGFDPSPDAIKYSVEESWVGIKAMALKVAEMYPAPELKASSTMVQVSAQTLVLLFLSVILINLFK